MNDCYRCMFCNGTGRRPVGGVYLKTLRMLRERTRPVTGASLARVARCKATAMNNRLARLEGWGLAVSEWRGRERLYRAKETP